MKICYHVASFRQRRPWNESRQVSKNYNFIYVESHLHLHDMQSREIVPHTEKDTNNTCSKYSNLSCKTLPEYDKSFEKQKNIHQDVSRMQCLSTSSNNFQKQTYLITSNIISSSFLKPNLMILWLSSAQMLRNDC